MATHVRDRHASGFTLIELLIVISLIALLMALLLPTLQGARKAAQTAECLTRNRQFFVWIDQFHTDTRWYPVNTTWALGETAPGKDGNFCDQIQPYMADKHNQAPLSGYFVGTIGDTSWNLTARRNFFLCPGMNYQPQGAADSTYIYNNFSYISWGWKLENYIVTSFFGLGNLPLQPGTWWPKKTISSPYQPSNLALMGEIYTANPYFGYYTVGNYITPHNQRTNLLFADGHAATQDQATMNAMGAGKWRFW